jgi:hypothetical protein
MASKAPSDSTNWASLPQFGEIKRRGRMPGATETAFCNQLQNPHRQTFSGAEGSNEHNFRPVASGLAMTSAATGSD